MLEVFEGERLGLDRWIRDVTKAVVRFAVQVTAFCCIARFQPGVGWQLQVLPVGAAQLFYSLQNCDVLVLHIVSIRHEDSKVHQSIAVQCWGEY